MELEKNGEYIWDNSNNTKMGEYLLKVELKFILDYFNDKNNYNLFLEVGAGSGRLSIPLKNRGLHIISSELNILPLKKLRKKGPNIPVLLLDAQKLPFKNEAFDCIIGVSNA